MLDRLRIAGDEGTKASELRAFIEGHYGKKLHEKTVGMTLYRLAQQGQARREGRTWFLVTAPAETRNPGGETPGLDELLS